MPKHGITPQRTEYLRILKLAYKLHQAGLSEDECQNFIAACRDPVARQGMTNWNDGVLPTTKESPESILVNAFSWFHSQQGWDYWSDIEQRLIESGVCST